MVLREQSGRLGEDWRTVALGGALPEKKHCSTSLGATSSVIHVWSYRIGDLDLYPRLELPVQRSSPGATSLAIFAWSYRLGDLDLYPRLELPAQRSSPGATGSAILISTLAWSYRLSDTRLELLARRS